ncbi:hypothetical protein [Thalassospira xiamenensis]|uniref:hypothetical protein n=1 Tax=Thalassospira xiamenensis TaxID=220697 RepID=UPI0015F06466|nr:hypothetical protein [Thalassospira xiamenensis]
MHTGDCPVDQIDCIHGNTDTIHPDIQIVGYCNTLFDLGKGLGNALLINGGAFGKFQHLGMAE